MATKAPPAPTRRTALKGEPPVRSETKANLVKPEPSKTVALNFKVPAEFKRNFKIAAATTGITQSELLRIAFNLWNEKQG
jgi:hypothetical protein